MDDTQLAYNLGRRDQIAQILAETVNKVKLPEQAEMYKKNFEEHFSHKWHTLND